MLDSVLVLWYNDRTAVIVPESRKKRVRPDEQDTFDRPMKARRILPPSNLGWFAAKMQIATGTGSYESAAHQTRAFCAVFFTALQSKRGPDRRRMLTSCGAAAIFYDGPQYAGRQETL